MKISSKLLIVFFCLISLNTNVEACYGTADTLTRKKVGLVLSGGGAKGAAHVGVLKILEETGIPIDYIAGTSMGAIVGGLYAVGYSPAKIDSILRSQNWQELLTDKIPRDKMLFVEKKVTDKTIISIPFEKKRIDLPTGILSGGAILNMLSFFTTGYHDMATFDSLPIPFACIGYDLITGKEVVMRSGNLATAIRASMSIPGAFTMVERDDHILIDGGVINNFPVDVIRQMGADIVIGVDVSAITDTHAKIEKKAQEIPKEEFYGSLPFILQKLMDRMGTEKLQDNIKITDFYIHPKVEPYTTASFNAEAIDSLIHRGEQIALAYKDSLLALKKEIGIAENSRVNIDSLYRKGHNGYPVSDSIYIGKIFFEGIGFLDEQNLKQMLRIKENSHTTHKQIHNGLDRLKGSGFFSAVSYELNEYKGSYDLIISCKKRLNNFAGLGLRFDNKNIVTSFLQTNIAPAKLHGAVIDIKTRISLNPYLDACLYYQNAYIGRFGLSYHFNLGNYPLSSGLDTITNHVRSLTNRLNIELANFHYRNFNFFLTLQYENYTPLSCSFFRNSEDFSYPDPENLYIYRTGVNFDSFDNYYFPHSGTEFHAEYAVYTDDFSHYKEEHPFSVLSANISGAIPVSGHLTLLPGGFLRFVSRNGTPFNVQNFIGGYFPSNYTEQQIPFYGLHHISVVKKQLWGANLKTQYRFGNNHYAWIKLNFANFCESLNDILSQENLVSLFGGAVGYSFQSPLGPIDIMFDYCYFKGSKPGIFINFGKNF